MSKKIIPPTSTEKVLYAQYVRETVEKEENYLQFEVWLAAKRKIIWGK